MLLLSTNEKIVRQYQIPQTATFMHSTVPINKLNIYLALGEGDLKKKNNNKKIESLRSIISNVHKDVTYSGFSREKKKKIVPNNFLRKV